MMMPDPAPEEVNFEAWRAKCAEDPNHFVERFFSRFEMLTPEAKSAFRAAAPGRARLSQSLQSGNSESNAALRGLPYGLQDLFDLQGLPTRCGARFAEPFEALAEANSALVTSLTEKGATCLAKLVPSEFGVDLQGLNAHFGDCPNARDPHFVCGGGAGSCAHAVADDWLPVAFGLDSFAGIRIPAAFHGLYAFRMEHNNFAREGVFPIIPSLDSVGWMTKLPGDLMSVFDAFYEFGPDPSRENPRGYLLSETLQSCSSETKSGLMQLIRPLDIDEDPAMDKLFHKLFQRVLDAFKIIRNRELYSVHQYLIEEYSNYYDPQLLKLIEAGRTYSAADCEEASHVQINLRASLISFFLNYDYVILPVSPLASPQKAEWDTAFEEQLTFLNAPLSAAFLPALIVPFPCGEGRFNAAQFIFNPRKLYLVRSVLEQIKALNPPR